MAGALGFEPRAFGFGDRRSNQLSYAPVRVAAVARAGTRSKSVGDDGVQIWKGAADPYRGALRMRG